VIKRGFVNDGPFMKRFIEKDRAGRMRSLNGPAHYRGGRTKRRIEKLSWVKSQSHRFRTGVTIRLEEPVVRPKSTYGEFLVEEQRIRPVRERSSTDSPRTPDQQRRDRADARRGEGAPQDRPPRPCVIGPKGAEVDKLKACLED